MSISSNDSPIDRTNTKLGIGFYLILRCQVTLDFFFRVSRKNIENLRHLKHMTDTDFSYFVVMYFGLVPKAMLTSALFPVRYPLPLLKQN